MIWNKINGLLNKNRVGGVVLCLILSFVFVSLFGTSRCFATSSTTFKEAFLRYTDNWTSSQGTWGDSTKRGLTQFPNFITNTGEANTSSLTWNIPYPYGYSALYFTTNNFAFTQNNLFFHAEYNFVVGTYGNNSLPVEFLNLNNLNISSCNHTIASKNLSYHITDWSNTANTGGQNHTYTFKTITLYIDLALKDLTVGSQGNISCGIDAGGLFMRQMSTVRAFAYNEKFTNTIDFYNSPNDAIQSATNSALQQQTQIMEWQRQAEIERQEREAQDRANVQNVSDDATADGNSATSSAQTATSSILGAITGIYNTLLHPQQTNCNIGPINIYDELNLGTLDMCTLWLPDPFWPLASILMIGIVVLLGWSVLRAGLSLYRDLFGGK